jgi:hypothetical protein
MPLQLPHAHQLTLDRPAQGLDLAGFTIDTGRAGFNISCSFRRGVHVSMAFLPAPQVSLLGLAVLGGAGCRRAFSRRT